ncbi:MAG: phosphoribosylglycinamide formyltransferase [Devosia sp.]|nr:phosphoribosylglycinamide formyltransferase [Devosia sp.]
MIRKRTAILISGRGSNMLALIEAAKAADYPAEIVGVFSNKLDAGGLAIAREHGIATAALSHRDYPDRAAFDTVIDAQLREWGAEIVCLAGFMRVLSTPFVEHWRGRMLNIHPSLLPAFRGLDTHQRALDAGVSEHGCTVHWVTPGLDEGDVILQARVPVLYGDTPDTLAARILVEEHRIYPIALATVARGDVQT